MSNLSLQKPGPSIPAPEEFFLRTPPYSWFQIEKGKHLQLLRIQFYIGTLDTHCLECGRATVFNSEASPLMTPQPSERVNLEMRKYEDAYCFWPVPHKGASGPRKISDMGEIAVEPRVFHVPFACTRNADHKLHFFFRVQHGRVAKVGQSPSLADLQTPEVTEYRKILGDEKYREFTRAIGLHTHGVGIGAFVYLRRILEDLVISARDQAANEEGWDEDAFQRGRMDEKIRLLARKLPEFLVENRGIYSILSVGIHELSEEQCLLAFAPVKAGIELILDEKLAERKRNEKVARTQEDLKLLKKTN